MNSLKEVLEKQGAEVRNTKGEAIGKGHTRQVLIDAGYSKKDLERMVKRNEIRSMHVRGQAGIEVCYYVPTEGNA